MNERPNSVLAFAALVESGSVSGFELTLLLEDGIEVSGTLVSSQTFWALYNKTGSVRYREDGLPMKAPLGLIADKLPVGREVFGLHLVCARAMTVGRTETAAWEIPLLVVSPEAVLAWSPVSIKDGTEGVADDLPGVVRADIGIEPAGHASELEETVEVSERDVGGRPKRYRKGGNHDRNERSANRRRGVQAPR